MSEHLKRRIGLPLLTAYGVGVMVGAGIYVLVGAVASAAGPWALLSFFLAGLIAAPTALSYAEFSTRLPEAAGEAAYIRDGLARPALGTLVGLAIVAAGTVSAAAVLRGGAGYLTAILPFDPLWTSLAMGLFLVGVAVIGVLESLALAAVFTAVELAGLGLVIWAGATAPPVVTPDTLPPLAFAGLGAGAVLAFFAFIGFEDIVNMAEETAAPERTLPRAILLSLGLTTVIYIAVAWAALRSVPAPVLSGSEQPLALVWQETRGGSAAFLSTIAVFAALNGVLAQVVMAARVLYGLGRTGGPLRVFHKAHPRFGTPVLASLVVGGAVIAGAVALPIATLAETTSAILLSVFVLVNAALIAVKRRGTPARFTVPMAVPVTGLVLALAALGVTVAGRL